MLTFLFIIAFFSYFTNSWQIFSFMGYGVPTIDLALLMIYFYVLKDILWDGKKLQIRLNYPILFYFIFIGACLLSGVSVLFSNNPDMMTQYMKTTIHFLFLAFIAVIAFVYKVDASVWTKVLKSWLIASIFINVFGVYQIVARAFDLPFAWLEYNNVNMMGRGNFSSIDEVSQLSLKFKNFYRATSILPEPSALSAFNVLIQAFIIVPFMQRSKPFFKSKFLMALIFICSLVAIFLTFSLTGVLGLAMILTSVFIFEKRIKLKAVLSVLAISSVLIVITDTVVESYSNISVLKLFGNRISGIVDEREGRRGGMSGESFGTRVESAEQSLGIWYRHPVLGIGMGLTDYDKESTIGFADFGILSALSETGIIGGLSFFAMFITIFYKSHQMMKYRTRHNLSEDEDRLFGLSFYIMLQLFLINFIVSNNIVNMALWLPITIVFSSMNIYEEKIDNKAYIIPFVKTSIRRSISFALIQNFSTSNSKINNKDI